MALSVLELVMWRGKFFPPARGLGRPRPPTNREIRTGRPAARSRRSQVAPLSREKREVVGRRKTGDLGGFGF